MGAASNQPHRGRYRLHPPADEVTRRRAGEANPRGGLLKPDGPFVLRDGVAAPGAMPLFEAFDLVAADWDEQVAAGNVSRSAMVGYKSSVGGLLRTTERQGGGLVADITPNLIWMWMRAANPRNTSAGTTARTMSHRRSAARMFFQTAHRLGITDINPAMSVEVSGISHRYVRPFTDGEITTLKQTSRHRLDETRMPAALALCLSGATPAEITHVTVDDVDLTNQRVWLHGGGYRQRDRWVSILDDWCLQALTRRIRELRRTYGDDAGAVCIFYKPHPSQPTPTRQASAATQRLSELLHRARVWQPGVTRVESIREWTALTVYAATGSLEEVACRLGMSSLDAVAHLVGHDWAETYGIQAPPPVHRRGEAP